MLGVYLAKTGGLERPVIRRDYNEISKAFGEVMSIS